MLASGNSEAVSFALFSASFGINRPFGPEKSVMIKENGSHSVENKGKEFKPVQVNGISTGPIAGSEKVYFYFWRWFWFWEQQGWSWAQKNQRIRWH